MTQLPTGGGKTEIAGALLKDFLVDGRKAVWLTHRQELAEQSADRLKDHWLIPAMPLTKHGHGVSQHRICQTGSPY